INKMSVFTITLAHCFITLQVESQVEAKLPGVCWRCKWVLRKEEIKQKLLSVCLVKKHLRVLIEELNTGHDVRTICVNIKACNHCSDD
uniref:Saposin B-type domain-containing protein n=1 Tax=Oncorhynchus kisutch TaxID=8019 RepID=A0A8C7F127_ONCKI